MDINDINAMKNELNALKEKANNLEAMITKAEKMLQPAFDKVKKGDSFYYIGLSGEGLLKTYHKEETDSIFNNCCYKNNNYFHTQFRAQGVCDKILFLLKLERLYDTFCPDYIPDWNDHTVCKYYVYCYNNEYHISYATCSMQETTIYFPTKEIADKVCEILNSENEKEDN